jgi:hypothetical protein
MDKVLLSPQDIETLLLWRDAHKEEVYSAPIPLEAVEIICSIDQPISIKAIRDGRDLKLHIRQGDQTVGNLEYIQTANAMWRLTKNKSKLPRSAAQSYLTVYCSLMALMVYNIRPNVEAVQPKDRTAPRQKSTKKRPKVRQGITYILRSNNGRLLAAPQGSHASPSGVFSVRGHYRHYKDGKTVWISPYQKGTGKEKTKTYKLGRGAG